MAKNHLKITLHQTKIISSLFYKTIFSLKLKVLDQTLISDKISGKFFDYNKSFFFDIPNKTSNANLEISANIKSFLFFDTEIGKLNLPVNLSKLLEKNEWYSIKNYENEIILMLLISLSYNNSSDQEPSHLKNNSKKSINISYDKIKVHLNKSIISNTIDDMYDKNNQNNSHIINISHLDLNNLSHLSKIKINSSSSKKSQIPSGQSGAFSNVPNDTSKLSIFSNNCKQHVHKSSNPTSSDFKKSNRADYSEYISTLDSILEADEQSNSKKISVDYYAEIKKKFIAKYNILKEKREKLNKFVDELKGAKNKLRDNENLLKKERDLYDSQIKQLQAEKQSYSQNKKVLQKKIKKLYDNSEEYQNILNYDKELFLNLNFLVNVPSNIDDKFQELNQNFSRFVANQKKKKRNNVESNIEERDLVKASENSKQFSITFPGNLQVINNYNINFNKDNRSIMNSQKIINLSNYKDNDTENLTLKSESTHNCTSKVSYCDSSIKFHPPTAKIDLQIDDSKHKVSGCLNKNTILNLEGKDSTTKLITVEMKLNSNKFVSGSSEKLKKSTDVVKSLVNIFKKDSTTQVKKFNPNINIKRISKGNEQINIYISKQVQNNCPKVRKMK